MKQELHFIQTVEAFETNADNLSTPINALETWIKQLQQQLQQPLAPDLPLHNNRFFIDQWHAYTHKVLQQIDEWQQEQSQLDAVQAVAQQFDCALIFLVFGKFNAGKSSFCNFIANRFQQHHLSVQYFRVEDGTVHTTGLPFKEGTTETTSQLQGVFLGNKLVLLDTPGLHSITNENAELALRFTQSADGMLWLTSSASPGQVQELEELARELHRGKALLPIITRSDYLSEDEVNGEIVKLLCNKSIQNRQLQELDVHQRATEKLLQMGIEPAQLKTPISISVLAAQDQTESQLKKAGFHHLYTALQQLVESATSYKQHKPVSVLLHHIEENMIDGIKNKLEPQINAIEQTLITNKNTLHLSEEQLNKAIWRQIIPTLPPLLDKYEKNKNITAVYQTLSTTLCTAFSEQLAIHFSDYQLEPTLYSAPIDFKKTQSNHNYETLYNALEQALYQHITACSLTISQYCEATLESGITYCQIYRQLLHAQIDRLPHPKKGQTSQITASLMP